MAEEHEALLYPRDVEDALQASLGRTSGDIEDDSDQDAAFAALEAADFDPVDFVNEKFPDERSFALLEPFLGRLQTHIAGLDDAILDAVKLQSTRAESAAEEIVHAKDSIKQLQRKVSEIRGKAEESEEMVEKICKDIKKLDYAKKHLTFTISSLQKFHMLNTAVDELTHMVKSRRYRVTANLLQAISQLLSDFEQHRNVTAVAAIQDHIAHLRQEVTEQIFHDFDSLSDIAADYSLDGEREASVDAQHLDGRRPSSMQQQQSMFLQDTDSRDLHTYDDPADPSTYTADTEDESEDAFYDGGTQTPESLAGACAVADALGSRVRRQIIQKVCEIWLKPYDRLFEAGAKYSGIDATERRYAWLRRLLKDNEERYDAIFPSAWRMNKHLTVAFVLRTERHLKEVLKEYNNTGSDEDVSVLIRALRKTLDFEHEMAVKFEYADKDDGAEKEEELSPRKIREKYGAKKTATSEVVIDESEELLKARREAVKESRELPAIKGIISSVFDPHLQSYVKLVAKKMREELEKAIAEEDNDSNDLPYFSSSSQMFLFIRNAINQCVQFTTGQAFFDLYLEFGKVLNEYAAKLRKRLPSEKQALNEGTARMCCFVLNSAEYCAETIEQLEELIRGKVDEHFREKIELETQGDQFFATITQARNALVGGLHALIKDDFVLFQKTNWAQVREISDQSQYISSLASGLQKFIPIFRDLLSFTYFLQFCSRFGETFIQEFTAQIFKGQKLNEMAAQQFMLDARAIRSILLDLPKMGESQKLAGEDLAGSLAASYAPYSKFVENEMSRCEAILKLAGMNLDTKVLIESFKVLLQDGTQEDLRQVLELKGMKAQDQDQVMKLAEAEGIPPGKPRKPPQYQSSVYASNGTNGTDSASSRRSEDSFSKVFSKVTAAASSSSSGKSFSSFGANLSSSLQQSYQQFRSNKN